MQFCVKHMFYQRFMILGGLNKIVNSINTIRPYSNNLFWHLGPKCQNKLWEYLQTGITNQCRQILSTWIPIYVFKLETSFNTLL